MTNPNIAKDSPATYKKGQSGNPKGAPKKDWTMTELYRKAGEEVGETGLTKKELVAQKLWKIAEKGDITAIKELGNRIDGMPKQSLIHEGDEDNPIVYEININDLLNKSYGNKHGSSK